MQTKSNTPIKTLNYVKRLDSFPIYELLIKYY
jgi:hypothetical protein